MLIYKTQKILGQVTTKIMQEQFSKRKRNIEYQVELIVKDIKENSFRFKKNTTLSSYDPEVVRTFNFNGFYSKKNISLNFKLVINKNDKPVVVAYDVYINEKGEVICKSDDYENFVFDISPKTLIFNIGEKREITFKEASEKFGVAASTLRHRQRDGRFEDGDTRKSGNTWLVTESAMQRLYGKEIEND